MSGIDITRYVTALAVEQLQRERDEARRVLLAVLDGYADALTQSAKHRAEKRRLIEAAQRERDRAQSIIHHVARGGSVAWGMFLRADGTPEPQP